MADDHPAYEQGVGALDLGPGNTKKSLAVPNEVADDPSEEVRSEQLVAGNLQ